MVGENVFFLTREQRKTERDRKSEKIKKVQADGGIDRDRKNRGSDKERQVKDSTIPILIGLNQRTSLY